jgi:hypothetical protein
MGNICQAQPPPRHPPRRRRRCPPDAAAVYAAASLGGPAAGAYTRPRLGFNSVSGLVSKMW